MNQTFEVIDGLFTVTPPKRALIFTDTATLNANIARIIVAFLGFGIQPMAA